MMLTTDSLVLIRKDADRLYAGFNIEEVLTNLRMKFILPKRVYYGFLGLKGERGPLEDTPCAPLVCNIVVGYICAPKVPSVMPTSSRKSLLIMIVCLESEFSRAKCATAYVARNRVTAGRVDFMQKALQHILIDG